MDENERLAKEKKNPVGAMNNSIDASTRLFGLRAMRATGMRTSAGFPRRISFAREPLGWGLGADFLQARRPA
jgi:hypothetical protein